MKVLNFLWIIILISFSDSTQAVDIYQADKLFSDKNYGAAFNEYQKSAELGNPHAHYRLGIMLNNGLGVDKDVLTALLYLSLAADANYKNAKTLVKQVLQQLPEPTREKVNVFLTTKKRELKAKIKQQYHPIFLTDVPIKGIKKEINLFTFVNVRKNIVESLFDTDREADGSERNVIPIFKKFHFNGGRDFYNISVNQLCTDNSEKIKPRINNFSPRSYLGLCWHAISSDHNNADLAKQNMRLSLRRLNAKNSNDARFSIAMLYLLNPWLTEQAEQPEDIEKGFHILQELAEEKYPKAMYLLGSRHYFYTGRDMPLGLQMITDAATYNYAPAEYRLAKLMVSVPWVKKDEKKALFWFESAAEKSLEPAMLGAANILLAAEDINLHNRERALYWLNQITQKGVPQYHYLMALAYKAEAKTNWQGFFNSLERAIFLARMKGWDTSEWQALYDKYIKGDITINDEEPEI